ELETFGFALFYDKGDLFFNLSHCKEPIYEGDIVYDSNDKFHGTTWVNGIVPYIFDPFLSANISGTVKKAMERIESVSSVKFVERTNEQDYIKIVSKEGSYSCVGRQCKGEQELSIAAGDANSIGIAMHELMHVLGVFHEHSRPDRDNFLTVTNFPDDINFVKIPDNKAVCHGAYDLESIMHYEPGVYNNQKIELKPGIMSKRIGQRERLSQGDIDGLNKLYPPRSERSMWGFWKR
ncbi:1474_t:CDS:2, partial [Paraglomus brasilianum]